MRRWLAHPLTRDLALDDPALTSRRADVLLSKPFLRRVYREWYSAILAELPEGSGMVLELGAGGGFLRELLPELVASDVMSVPGVQLVADAGALPVADFSLRGIVMTNVLHHLPDPEALLREAARCLRPGGRIVMLEPWVTWWSTIVYRNLHHEPFEPRAIATRTTGSGPLTRANGAIPWILFERDRRAVASRHPALELKRITPTTPFRYLLSGGLAWRFGAPLWSFSLASAIDALMAGLGMGMFAHIVVERRAVPSVEEESSLDR